MKQAAVGYAAILTAMACYASVFYKAEVESSSRTFNFILDGLVSFCVIVVVPGLLVLFAVRKAPALSLIYLAVILAWTATVVLSLRQHADHRHEFDKTFVVWMVGALVGWVPLLLVTPFAVVLALDKRFGLRDERRSSPDDA